MTRPNSSRSHVNPPIPAEATCRWKRRSGCENWKTMLTRRSWLAAGIATLLVVVLLGIPIGWFFLYSSATSRSEQRDLGGDPQRDSDRRVRRT